MNRELDNIAIVDLLNHAGWLRSLAMHLAAGHDLGEDAIQDTWASALANPPDPALPPRPWLARVAHNFVRRRYRSESRRSRHEAAAGAELDLAIESPEVLALRAEAYQTLAGLVAKLEPRHQTVILLRYYENKNSNEIGLKLGLPPGTVRRRIKEALEALRHQFAGEYGGQSRSSLAVLFPVTSALSPLAAPVALATGMGKKIGVGAFAVGALLAALLAVRYMRDPTPGPQPPGPFAGDSDQSSPLRPAFMFPPAAEHGSVEGKVIDNKGQPIANATLTVSPRLQGHLRQTRSLGSGTLAVSTRSDAQGRFRLPQVRPGLLGIAAAAKGYHAKGSSLTVDPGQEVKDLVIELAPGGVQLSGTVVDTGGGALPAATVGVLLALPGSSGVGAEQMFAAAEALADGSGRFELWMSPGPAQIQIEANGYATAREWLTIVADTHREFRLHPAAKISGRVIQAVTGVAVPDAQIFVSAVTSFGESLPLEVVGADGDGRFATAGLDPGRYVLHARTGTLTGKTTQAVALGLGDSAEVVVELHPGLSVSGRITDGAGKPVAGAKVAIGDVPVLTSTREITSITDKNGHYKVQGVAPGQPNVFVVLDGYADASKTINVIDEPLTGVDLQLAPEARLRVLVRDEKDRPVQGALGNLVVTNGAFSWAREADAPSDREGLLHMRKLAAGPVGCKERAVCGWTLTVGEPCRSSTSERVILVAGQTTEVTLRLGGGGRVRGRVFWDDGSAATGTNVDVRQGRATMPSRALVDEQGRFEVANLVAGRYIAQARVPDGVLLRRKTDPRSFAEVNIAEGATVEGVRLELPKQDKKISGVIQDAHGHPVAGAQVGVLDHQEGQGGWARCDDAFGSKRTSDLDGRFTIDKLPAGLFTFCGRHLNHPDVQQTGVASGSTGHVFRFKAGGSVSGRVVFPSGVPVAQFVIVATIRRASDMHSAAAPIKGAPRATQLVTDRKGQFTLTGLEPGTFDLLAMGPKDERGVALGVKVEAGHTQSGIEIAMRAPIKISGQVVLADNTQAVHATIIDAADFMAAGLRPPKPVTTDDDGRFTITTAMPGTTCLLMIEPLGGQGAIGDTRELWLPPTGGDVDLGLVKLLRAEKKQSEKGEPYAETGLRVGHEGGHPFVTGIYENSPAAKAGILVRDRVISVEGRPVDDLGGKAIGHLLLGEVGTETTVRVQSGSNLPRDVRVSRGRF